MSLAAGKDVKGVGREERRKGGMAGERGRVRQRKGAEGEKGEGWFDLDICP